MERQSMLRINPLKNSEECLVILILIFLIFTSAIIPEWWQTRSGGQYSQGDSGEIRDFQNFSPNFTYFSQKNLMILMKNWLRVKWSLFWGWSLILKIGQIKSVNDPYRKSAKRVSFAKDHDSYKKWVYAGLGCG